MPKITREKFKTYKNVFDEFTLRNLFILQSKGIFYDLESPVSIGKEANIFTALRKDKSRVILKIYRLETADFNRMYNYIKSDPRFQGLKKQKRKVIFAWCKREYRNLLILEKIVRVPQPFAFKDNILVIECIGNEYVSPKLKDAVPRDLKRFFNDIIYGMKKIYESGFVHGDLSEFNILNHEEKPVFIDVSTLTPLEDPNSREYLDRDVRNICRFFRKHGLKVDEENIKKTIVGL
ncbi:serine protein kinase RIO [Candidatus Woesearchaeota archaeon]|nr:MAG: serine protein kinase RIO [Candidatus Woesearchaeota archaeon]